jgi:hypothetical protein
MMVREWVGNGLAAMFIAGLVTGVTTPVHAGEDGDSTGNVCAVGMERVLPGDYYACKAVTELKHKNLSAALTMLHESARWANKNSQRLLGIVYFNGDDAGVAKNRPLGLAWLKLASERGDPEINREYTEAKAHSSEEDVAESERLAATMVTEYGDTTAGPRAVNHFNEKVREMTQVDRGHDYVIVYGFGPYGRRADVVARQLEVQAKVDFAGLTPTVTVGPLESAPAGQTQ